MNKDILISALLATYEAHKELVPLLDEDFAEDHKGVWVKYEGRWNGAHVLMLSPGITNENYNHIHSLPRFSLITTWEQRAIRTATRRAEQLLAAQTAMTP